MGARATDPVIGFHFSLELSGKVTGYFTEISGLGSETEIVEHKIVNDKGIDSVQKIPGRLKWGDITLKRGVTAAMDFWQWRKLVEDGNIVGARAHGSIIMMDQALKPIAQWDFTNGWPSKVSGPTVQSDSNAFGVEEMTIAHEGIVRVL
jgi:phage tail-like protein